jgi:uncharacterized protein (DUF305 family)
MKNNTIFGGAIVSVLLGLFIGYAVWGNKAMDNNMNMNMGMSQKTGGHMMPDGTVMGGMRSTMSMESMMTGMMANLKGKTGNEFDKAFLTEMVMHHEGAVVMAQAVLTSTDRPELKKLANEIILAQNKEVTQMREWYKSWYGVDLK